MIVLRFVTCEDLVSRMIREAEDFWTSHVEAVVPEGYLGAHDNGGVQIRPIGYDKETLIKEEFVTLIADDAMSAKFDRYIRSHINEPYDFAAILGFVLRTDMHEKSHAICSAFILEALQDCGWFKFESPVPSYQVSPRDLYLRLSGLVKLGG